jgi:hypothetical protein
MDEQTKKRIEEMTREEQERRFDELRQKLLLVDPMSISRGKTPPVTSLADHEEYQFLKKTLGFEL